MKNLNFKVTGYYTDYEYNINNEQLVGLDISKELFTEALTKFQTDLLLEYSRMKIFNIQLFIKVCYTDSQSEEIKSNDN